MLTTEEEAKTKRCQESYAACSQVSDHGHTRVATAMGGAFAAYTAPAMCLGSACMAWRWSTTFYVYGPDGTFRNAAEGDAPPDGSLMGGDPPRPFTYRRAGYCGKAGRP